MSFGQLPDFPVTPIVGRKKTAQHNSTESRHDVHPYFSTPIYGIPYAIRKNGTVLSGSSSSSLRCGKSGQGQTVGGGAGVKVATTLTSEMNEKERVVCGASSVGSRSFSGATVGTRSSSGVRSSSQVSGGRVLDAVVVSRRDSKGRGAGTEVGTHLESKTERAERSAMKENSEKVAEHPKFVPQSKSILHPIQNVGCDTQTGSAQVSDDTKRGKELQGTSLRSKDSSDQKSSQRSRSGYEKMSSSGQRMSREPNSESVSNNRGDSMISSFNKSHKSQDSNVKSTNKKSVVAISNVAALSNVSGSKHPREIPRGESSSTVEENSSFSRSKHPLEIQGVESNASAKISPGGSNKRPSRDRVKKKQNKKSKNSAAESNRQRNDRPDSARDSNLSPESDRQIADPNPSVAASRKRRINDDDENGCSAMDGAKSGQPRARVKRVKGQEVDGSKSGQPRARVKKGQERISAAEKSTKRVRRHSDQSRDDEPSLVVLRVKPKVYGRWKGIAKPAMEFFSRTSVQVFTELLNDIRTPNAAESVRCFDELRKRLDNEISRITVPTSKVSTNFWTLTDQQNCLQNDVKETSEEVEHLSELVERTKLAIQKLSAERSSSLE